MRFPAVLLISVSVVSVFAQDTTTTTQAPEPSASDTNPMSNLAGSFFEHDYFNFNAFGAGVYNTYAPIEENNHEVNNGAAGFDLGGGVNAHHAFRDGIISVLYEGSYSDYESSSFSSGTSQTLVAAFSKRLSRRWSFSWNTSAGIFLYGGTYYSAAPAGVATTVTTPSNTVIENPFSPETRYLTTGVSTSYQQTRRLSYVFSGAFTLLRYNTPGSIGTTGGTGSAGADYRLTARTTVIGSYGQSEFQYQHGVGQASIEALGGTVTHRFGSHWMASLSGGINRAHSTGTAVVPVTLLIGQGAAQQAVGGYVLGHYNLITHVPSYSGSISHSYHRSVLSATAGEGVAGAGNGYYLASRSTSISGVYSYSIERRSNFGVGGSFYRLSSISNTVSHSYSTATLNASYGTTLVRHVGAFVRYSFIHYGTLRPFAGVSDNVISFGFNFSSKSIPMTLF